MHNVASPIPDHAIRRPCFGPWIEHHKQTRMTAGHAGFNALVDLIGNRVPLVQYKKQIGGVFTAEFSLPLLGGTA